MGPAGEAGARGGSHRFEWRVISECGRETPGGASLDGNQPPLPPGRGHLSRWGGGE